MTDLREHLIEIQNGLTTGSFPNEAAISQGVVIRLLQALGWPVYDPQIVFPEYGVAGTRVDFALCYPRTKPLVFIEVKQLGKSEGADQQLFQYAFHEGVPMAILTDGQEWNFYLPAERGNYEERRVYKLDIFARNVEETDRIFKKYLQYDDVCSGKSIETAKADYKGVARQREIKRVLPIAWARLMEERDELLIELVAEKTENLCGFKPDKKIIEDFLISKGGLGDAPLPEPKRPNKTSSDPIMKPKISTSETKIFTGYIFLGQTYSTRNAIETVIDIFKRLMDEHPNFLQAYDSLPRHGRTRRYIARVRTY